ncbi:MAG: hypothetical protein RIM84_20355 [Alphaproteobacteria bacterium]
MQTPHYDWIACHAACVPDSPAQEDLASGRRFTYAEMNARVVRLAGANPTEPAVIELPRD